MGNFCCHYNY